MTTNKNTKTFLVIASFFMALGVAIGAFGAHGLKARVDEYMMAIFNTGVEYHFYSTLGLFAISFISHILPNSKRIVVSGYLLLIGSTIFSFSLYLLVILNLSWLGAITPIGGTLMIVSWLLASYTIFKELRVECNK